MAFDINRIGEQIAQIVSTLGSPSVSTERHNINSKFKVRRGSTSASAQGHAQRFELCVCERGKGGKNFLT